MEKGKESDSKVDDRLVLPTPDMAKSLADDAGGAVSSETSNMLAGLERASGALLPEKVVAICNLVLTEARAAGADSNSPGHFPPDGRGPTYDFYFAVERLPKSAKKDAIMAALTVATAVAMKNTATLEQGTSAISRVEFGLLRHAFAVIVEALQELAAKGTP
jgi:hypothetical protein